MRIHHTRTQKPLAHHHRILQPHPAPRSRRVRIHPREGREPLEPRDDAAAYAEERGGDVERGAGGCVH